MRLIPPTATDKMQSYLMRICPHGDTESSGESKVRKLEVVILVDQQILGLQVAVKDTV